MSGTRSVGILASIVTVTLLSGCGVREVGEDGLGNGVDVATGSDTSSIAGFWSTNFGGYALISAMGEFSYFRSSDALNCFEQSTYPIVNQGINPATGNEQYALLESRSGLPPANTLFDTFMDDTGRLRIVTYGDTPSTAIYSESLEFLPQDLQVCDDEI